MKYSIILSFFYLFFISSCRNSSSSETANKLGKEKTDISALYLDSVSIFNFVNHHKIDAEYLKSIKLFYRKRNYELAWLNRAGVNEYAKNFMNLLRQNDATISKDSNNYFSQLMSAYNRILDDKDNIDSKNTELAELELLLTVGFFEYAKQNWKGGPDEDLIKVGWLIERKKINYENLLDTLLNTNARSVLSFEPVYKQYYFLKQYLAKYRLLEKQGAWPSRSDTLKELKIGDSTQAIVSIKKQLYLLRDLVVADSSYLFNTSLEEGVKQFQKRNGITADGIIAGKTLAALRVPIHELIEQLLINMERCRWVPIELRGDYAIVNIPAFKLFVYHNDLLEWQCNAIVGQSKVTSNTVIFNDTIEQIVFSPYWNITQSILRKETLPEIKKSKNYLATHNMEVVDFSGKPVSASSIPWENYADHFPYIIRQKPGKDNALGLVKFLFPNPYDIYLHDTPSKSLFEESSRTFSHGCIRIEEPYKLAQFLLRRDSLWNDEKINAAMNGGKEIFVKLKNKVPIFIVYFTAWVDNKGMLNLREDVYEHDKQMKKLLFAN